MEDSLIFHITQICSLIKDEFKDQIETAVKELSTAKANAVSDDVFLTTQEVADLLKISKSTVIKLRGQGLPSIKIFDSVRFSKKAVLKFIHDQNGDTT